MNNNFKSALVPGIVMVGIFSAIFGYGKLNEKVQTNVKDIAEIKVDTKKIPVIENDVKHIMTEQQVMRVDIKKILRAVQ